MRFAQRLSSLEKQSSATPVGAPDIDELVHDLRGPLSVIVAFAESLEGAGREERARFAERLVVNAHRALAVLEEFAALSDLRAESVELSNRPMDLAEVVLRAGDDVSGLQQGVRVHCLVPTDGVPMMGDRDLIGMALRAVLRKVAAGAALPAALRLQVAGDDDLARVELRVTEVDRDGYDIGELDAVEFEILRRVVALHGGRVVFENDDPGFTVGFCIPRHPR